MATQQEIDQLAAELAKMPNVPERLLERHLPDGSGRCSVCSAGAQTGRYQWPCVLSKVAARAIEMRQANHG